jgi:hypothetical protein
MRLNEFKHREYKANTGTVKQFRKEQALKDREEIQRELKRKEYNDSVVDKITANVLAAVLKIINGSDEAITVKTDFI